LWIKETFFLVKSNFENATPTELKPTGFVSSFKILGQAKIEKDLS